jgi:hypothetical protein
MPTLTSVPDLVDWVSRTDGDFPSIRRLLLNLSAGTQGSEREGPPIQAFKSSKKLYLIGWN